MTMTRVLIATADSTLRNALKLLLRQRLPMAVVGEGATATELAPASSNCSPTFCSIDWALPEFHDPTVAVYQVAIPYAHIVVLSVA